uniref:Uncharacterized protein n=1 Tax=Strigamia maritima TaxID=126957 RepID=T1J9U3_STRMM
MKMDIRNLKFLASVPYVSINSHDFKYRETNLVDKFDFVHLPLNPNERLQTLSLCGFCPDVILDICSRAISFWVYQVHLEITYQEFLANKTKQRYKQLEASHDDENAKLQVEIACILYYTLKAQSRQLEGLEQQLEVIRNEITVQKDNVNELNDKLSETHRESQRLKVFIKN